jgi:hypothetical protein
MSRVVRAEFETKGIPFTPKRSADLTTGVTGIWAGTSAGGNATIRENVIHETNFRSDFRT